MDTCTLSAALIKKILYPQSAKAHHNNSSFAFTWNDTFSIVSIYRYYHSCRQRKIEIREKQIKGSYRNPYEEQ